MARILRVDRGWLYAHPEHPLTAEQRDQFDRLVARRRKGEPIAYLTGSREFFGRNFRVTPAVLIPRPETEHVVELALELSLPDAAEVADIGTGSGCIALTLALERPGWRIRAGDLSESALAVAATNRRLLQANDVELLAGDLFTPFDGRRFDLIVSNPPYVATDDPHLGRGDVRHEPAGALEAGAHGLSCLRRLIGCAPGSLRPGGWLVVEHGHDQGESVRKLMQESGLGTVKTIRDLAGLERVTSARCRQ